METIIKQTNDAYVVIPSTPAGLLTGEQLAKIAELVNAGAGFAKLTTGQRIAIVTTEDKIEDVRQGLEAVGLKIGPAGRAVRNVKGCPGALCEFAKQDALNHAIAIDNEFSGREMPNTVKIGVSGCPPTTAPRRSRKTSALWRRRRATRCSSAARAAATRRSANFSTKSSSRMRWSTTSTI